MGWREEVVVFDEELEAVSDVVAVELLGAHAVRVDADGVEVVELLGHGSGRWWGVWA